MSRIVEELVEDALREIADESWQRRLWLVSEGPEVPSFIECHERLVDDSGLGDALEKPEVVYDQQIDDQLRELIAILGRIDGFRKPQEILDDPLMTRAREMSAALIEDLRRFASDEPSDQPALQFPLHNSIRLTVQSLATILVREGTDPNAYSLTGGHPSEAYVLDVLPEGWVFYYSERGLETGRRIFEEEDEACRFFLDQILRDLS